MGQGAAVAEALRSPRQRVMLVGSGLLLGTNWWVFIYAVNTDRIVDTSLGYYLTPLLNVAIGVLLFGERLVRAQQVAVVLAAAGVAYMAWDFGRLPWISLTLGGSFALYGALRKSTTIPSLGGLLVEAAVMSLPSLAYLLWVGPGGSTADAAIDAWPLGRPGLVVACGLITAFPLVCFGSAAKRLPLSAVGIFQYIAPSLSLGVAVWLYDEAFTVAHGITFGLIWCALALYTWDGFVRVRRLQAGRRPVR
jgi:chloramphenicol-sensitive protein RarD